MISLKPSYPVTFTSSQGEYQDLHSPNDLKFLTKIQYATASDIDYLLKQIPSAQANMKKLTPEQRAEILNKVAKEIQAEASLWAEYIATEGGKPLKDAKVEVSRAQSTFELCAEETVRLHGEEIPMGRTKASEGYRAYTVREAIGPVLAISAFNHPLNLLAHQVGCAIATGNAVVIKPAPATPLCALKLEEVFKKAGLPDKCLFVVNAEIPEIEKLASSSTFDYVSFIGSAKVGWGLRKVLAPGTRLSLEHGGQAPAIVRADAVMDDAVASLIKGSFYHAGQVCISTQRIFVEESQFENFVSKFKAAAQKLVTGDARNENTDVGPLIRTREVERIRLWIDEAIAEGSKLVLGNEIMNQGQYLLPTILTNVPRNSKVMTEEVFGPLVCINSYTDEEELIRYLNTNEYIFEAAVFSSDIKHALHLAQEVATMTMVINQHNAFRVDWMPFGGHKRSGLGMGGVKYMMDEMTRLKQIIIKL